MAVNYDDVTIRLYMTHIFMCSLVETHTDLFNKSNVNYFFFITECMYFKRTSVVILHLKEYSYNIKFLVSILIIKGPAPLVLSHLSAA